MTASTPVFADLANRIAVVTGGGGAIGRAVAVACGMNRMKVGVLDVMASAAAETAEAVSAAGGDTHAIHCDVADERDVAAAFDEIERRWGAANVAVACAGTPGSGRALIDSDPVAWLHVLKQNVFGTYLCFKFAASAMVSSGFGSLIAIGSTAGRTPRLCESDYSAAKAAIEHLTRVAAIEGAPHGIRANVVAPGATDSPFIDADAAGDGVARTAVTDRIVAGDLQKSRPGIPLRRLAEPPDHAAAVLYLCSDVSRHITGQVLYVDGGESVL